MAQGKIVKAEKKLNDSNVQESWTNKEGKVFYKSFYEFDNGDAGTALHVSQDPKFKVGDELTYEKSVNNYGTSFKGLKDVNNTFNKNSSWMSAEQSLRSTCINTIFVLRNTSPAIDLTAAVKSSNILMESLKETTKEKKDAIMVQSAMKIAREQIQYKSLEEFLEITKKIYQYIKG